MFAILKQILFGSRFALSEKAHAEKSAALEELLGPVYDEVNEAIERNDLCYFARCLPGTAVATCHLIQASGNTAGFLRRPFPTSWWHLPGTVWSNVTDDAVASFNQCRAHHLHTRHRRAILHCGCKRQLLRGTARRGETGYLVFLEYTR